MMDLKAIGVVRSSYPTLSAAPRQGRPRGVTSEIALFTEFIPGLRYVDRCTHLFILYWLHMADRSRLSATPPGASVPRGVFATRSPNRPNPIGIGIVNLLEVNEGVLTVKGLDAIDGTPVLDIKPYISSLDCVRDAVAEPIEKGITP